MTSRVMALLGMYVAVTPAAGRCIYQPLHCSDALTFVPGAPNYFFRILRDCFGVGRIADPRPLLEIGDATHPAIREKET